MKIWISNRQRKTRISPETVRKKAGKILNALGWSEAELSLTLVNDRAMGRLNRETFGRRGPTNVIAFPLEASEAEGGLPTAGPGGIAGRPPGEKAASPPLVLGEVVISLETTRRQAAINGWGWRELFDFFLIHGILHLLGYDHETPEGEARMGAKIWELLALLHPKISTESPVPDS